MSGYDDCKEYRAVCRIEKLLSNFANSFSSVFTPNILMDRLKRPSEHKILSELGSLIQACLKEPSKQLEIVRWVVFHFDLPSPFLRRDETSTRNWISVRCSEQNLLDIVHQETIGEGSQHIATIYAPSIVAAKLREANPARAKVLLRKLWLYRLEPLSLRYQNDQNGFRRQVAPSGSDILCFAQTDNKHVYVFSSENDHNPEGVTFSTLGDFLGGEDEHLSTNRFQKFAKLIRYRNANKFSSLKKKDVTLKCNFYARIPVFFYFTPQEYLTEIFVAFYEPSSNIQKVVTVLNDILPALRICVSLINSQIAYSIGYHTQIQEQIQYRLQEQSHTILNCLPNGLLSMAVESKRPAEARQLTSDALRLADILEVSFLIALDRGLPETFPKSVIAMLYWLRKRCLSSAAKAKLHIDRRCRDILFREEQAASAFTILWNLWSNAEKVTRYYSWSSFDVRVKTAEGDEGFLIEFENNGVMDDEWQRFLFSDGPSPNRRKQRSGLEIVKNKIKELKWTIRKVAICGSDKTRIVLFVPSVQKAFKESDNG